MAHERKSYINTSTGSLLTRQSSYCCWRITKKKAVRLIKAGSTTVYLLHMLSKLLVEEHTLRILAQRNNFLIGTHEQAYKFIPSQQLTCSRALCIHMHTRMAAQQSPWAYPLFMSTHIHIHALPRSHGCGVTPYSYTRASQPWPWAYTCLIHTQTSTHMHSIAEITVRIPIFMHTRTCIRMQYLCELTPHSCTTHTHTNEMRQWAYTLLA